MVRSVNIAELKDRLSLYLDEVRTGKEIVVRDRNTPIARIVPITRGADDDDELYALAARGKIRLGGKPLDDSFWDLPAPRVSTEALRRAIERDREEG
jgi:prevent-host-death family protein